MKLKKHDFIEIEYTGRLEDGTVFDTTDEKIAKDTGVAREGAKFGPVVICLGEGHILKGLEDNMLGKETRTFKIELKPEQAFGKKNAKLLRLIPLKVFRKENIAPFPGLEVNIDNMYGVVRTVSGGRVIVDFNHPLAGRNVKYELKVIKKIRDSSEKVKAILKNELRITDMKFELKEKKLIIDEKIPEDVFEALKKRVLKLIPEIKEAELKKEEKKAKSSKKSQKKKK